MISSLKGTVLFDASGRLAIAPALQDVPVRNVPQGNKVSDVLVSEGGQVAALSPDGGDVACGYSTGAVHVFNLATGTLDMALDSHKAAVEMLAYRVDGADLASDSRDTVIIVWDLMSRMGRLWLKGHKHAVTALAFLAPTLLASSSAKEIKKKCQRREKRQREKANKKQQLLQEAGKSRKLAIPKQHEVDEEDAANYSATDELKLLCMARSSHHVKSFTFSTDAAMDGTTSIMLPLQNNSIETYTLSPSVLALKVLYEKAHALTLSRHRSDVCQVAISSYNATTCGRSMCASKHVDF